jgi:hypothetical protein
MRWWSFKSKDKRVQGYCLAENRAGVARFANCPIGELVIKSAKWDKRKKEFVEVKR